MARPRMEGLTYFSHDCDAHRDEEKIEPLIGKHGLEGYGHYFFMLEVIYKNKNGEIDIALHLDGIARKMNISREKFIEILHTEMELGLFSVKNWKEIIDNSEIKKHNSGIIIAKLTHNSTITLILTSHGIKKRRNVVMCNRLNNRNKKVPVGFSPGKTQQEPQNNAGKGKGKGKGKIKGKGERENGENPAANGIEKVAFQKAEIAWTSFEDSVIPLLSSEKLPVIADQITRHIFFDLGGKEKIIELHGQDGGALKQVFVMRYAEMDIQNFKRR